MKFFSLIVGLWLVSPVWSSAVESLVYFGTYTGAKSKGIYVSKFDPATGKLSAPELAAEMRNPTFLAVHPGGHFLYSVNEVNGGTVNAFALDSKTGKLTPLNQKSSGGSGPCHLAVDASGKCLLVANYNSGSIAALPIQGDGSLGEVAAMIQHTGSSINLQRQAGPHAHFICPSPDSRFAFVCDLGLDKVLSYRLDAAAAKLSPGDPPFTTIEPGAGPRHMTFSPDGKFVYVISEMASTISVFGYNATNAAMTKVQTISTLPKNFAGNSTAAEITMQPSGKFIYASNRGDDSIVLFAANRKSGQLTFVERQSTQGRTPRHFAIDPSGHWLFAENQNSDSVVVFAIDTDTGKLKPTGQLVSIGSPVCAVFQPQP